jgi:hypothetical protein
MQGVLLRFWVTTHTPHTGLQPAGGPKQKNGYVHDFGEQHHIMYCVCGVTCTQCAS